jgi:hypothetical protein
MSWLITGTQKTDPDALAYLAEVERADGQSLESGVRDAVIAFVTGCKADGIWNAIKASCILAGARTLTGALVPLVGAAPTRFNFASGDYSRKTGLVGDGSTKYLNSNRNNNADPQNSKHLTAFVSQIGTTNRSIMGAGSAGTTGISTLFHRNIGTYIFRNNANTLYDPGVAFASGLMGASRQSSGSFTVRASAVNYTASVASEAPFDGNIEVFRAGNAPLGDARISFYSIGESLDLALLDSRVTTLINAFDAAI